MSALNEELNSLLDRIERTHNEYGMFEELEDEFLLFEEEEVQKGEL